MKLLETIRSAREGEVLRSLGRRFGLSEGETEQALQALVPGFEHSLTRVAESRTGAPAVHALIGDGRYRRYLDDPSALSAPVADEDGERVLGEIFGRRREREEAAGAAAGRAALTAETMLRLMPPVAALTVAALGRQSRDGAPSISGRSDTGPGDTGGATLPRMLDSVFGDEDVADRKKF